MDFKVGLHNRALLVEEHLKTYFLDEENLHEGHIHNSMRYSLLAGGKRIRPILLLEVGRLFGVSEDKLIKFACALEMIHTYSLIHDDLPAMDNDDLRRGKPTNHIVYGEAMAILAGDALLNAAFELMAHEALEQNDMGYVKAMDFIARAAGRKGMIGGQVADILSENQPGDEDTLKYIHRNKTGALLTASLVAACFIAHVDDSTTEILKQVGDHIGLIFQIKDDLLDIESSDIELGKPIGSDDKNNKLTYPSLYGIPASREKIGILVEEAINLLNQLSGDVSFLLELVSYIAYRKN